MEFDAEGRYVPQLSTATHGVQENAPVTPPRRRPRQVGANFQAPSPLEERSLNTEVPSSGDGPIAPFTQEKEDDPIRDTPQNLFLLNSQAAHSPPLVPDVPAEFEQPPNIFYVFRGKRHEHPNPLYNLSSESHEGSKQEYRNYTPSPSTRPKKGEKRKRQSTPSPSPSSSQTTRKPKGIKKRRAVAPAAHNKCHYQSYSSIPPVQQDSRD